MKENFKATAYAVSFDQVSNLGICSEWPVIFDQAGLGCPRSGQPGRNLNLTTGSDRPWLADSELVLENSL